jgi:TolB-like protein
MFTDIVGYTAMMQLDEDTARVSVNRFRSVLDECVPSNDGEVFQYYGDGSLSLFNTATEAVRCAVQMQLKFQENPAVPLRIGIHIGEVLVEGVKLFGSGVNVASRIESLGTTGTILFSKNVHDKVRNHSEFQSKSMGSFTFKNVDKPMEVFGLVNADLPVPLINRKEAKLKRSSSQKNWKVWAPIAFVALILVVYFLKDLIPTQNVAAIDGDNHVKSIAVLPFDNYTANEDNPFFAEAISNEIRSQLVGLKDLRVISRSSSKHYKGMNLSTKQIGEELNAGYILEGSVQRTANSVKISVELSNAKTEDLAWSPAPYERLSDDIFLLQNEIASQVVSQLKVQLSSQEKRKFEEASTENPEAYDAFLSGQELLQRDGGALNDLDEAVEYFKKAISLDSGFDRAYLGLAETYLAYVFWGRLSPKAAIVRATNAVEKVSDKTSGDYFGTLGSINFYKFQRDSALTNLNEALRLNPNHLMTYIKLAWIYSHDGNFEDAIDLLDQAQLLDPKSTSYEGYKAFICHYARQYDRGIDMLLEVLKDYPDDNWNNWVLGYLYAASGKNDMAIKTFQSRSVGQSTNWMLGYAYGMSGQNEKAQEILDFQLERRKNRHVPAYMIATIYLGMKDFDKTFEWLERDIEEGGQGQFIWGLSRDSKLDPLRGYPRFQALLASVQ